MQKLVSPAEMGAWGWRIPFLIGCLIVLVCTLAMIAGISWGGGRISHSEPSGSEAEFEPSGQS